MRIETDKYIIETGAAVDAAPYIQDTATNMRIVVTREAIDDLQSKANALLQIHGMQSDAWRFAFNDWIKLTLKQAGHFKLKHPEWFADRKKRDVRYKQLVEAGEVTPIKCVYGKLLTSLKIQLQDTNEPITANKAYGICGKGDHV